MFRRTLPPACLHVCCHGCPAGQIWLARHVCLTRKGGGDRGRVDGELLRSEEEFCSADDYTCRADAAPAASALARQSH